MRKHEELGRLTGDPAHEDAMRRFL